MLDSDFLIPLYLAWRWILAVGDPPNRFHPVAWIGRSIGAVERRATGARPALAFAIGMLLVVVGASVMVLLGVGIQSGMAHLPRVVAWLLTAILLKITLSLRGLADAAGSVRDALAADDLPAARALLSRHLVSRDTRSLDASSVAAAAVESVAENASDSLVAPLVFYAIGGLAGTFAYRFINTADAMIGYHTDRHEWLGKFAARTDDVLNLIPSRLTAWLMILAAPLIGGSAARGWTVWRRDARRTLSPNAGHPMSMAAGVLGVELAKAGHYTLGAGHAAAGSSDITRSIRLFAVTVALAVLFITAIGFITNI